MLRTVVVSKSLEHKSALVAILSISKKKKRKPPPCSFSLQKGRERFLKRAGTDISNVVCDSSSRRVDRYKRGEENSLKIEHENPSRTEHIPSGGRRDGGGEELRLIFHRKQSDELR